MSFLADGAGPLPDFGQGTPAKTGPEAPDVLEPGLDFVANGEEVAGENMARHLAVMPAVAVPVPTSEVVSSSGVKQDDADLSAAFGRIFGKLHKELAAKIVPAERTLMLSRVSKGARQALMAAKPTAVVKARGGGRRIAGHWENLGRTMSWCIILSLIHI